MHLLGLCLFPLLLTPGAQPDVLGSGAPHPVTCVLGTCLCAQGWPQDGVSGLLRWEKKVLRRVKMALGCGFSVVSFRHSCEALQGLGSAGLRLWSLKC